ncbi:MAG: nucleotidyltransferase family protein [Microcystaceae cyanobacterium]
MKIKTRQELIDLLQQSHHQLKAFGVRRFGIFGSFVRDQVSDHSDVDILVMFDPNLKTFDNFMGLSLFLEDLLERKIDLVTPDSLSPYLGHKILKEVEYVFFSD